MMSNPFILHQSQVRARLIVMTVSLCYVISLNFAHAVYLFPVQEIWGFPYHEIDLVGWMFIILSMLAVAAFIPLSFEKPSGLILFVIYTLVYLPTLTITVGLGVNSIWIYGASLVVLSIGLIGVCVLVKKVPRRVKFDQHPIKIRRGFYVFVLGFWVPILLFLIYTFHDIMSFVGLDAIYSQRELGRSQGWLEGYAQTYFAYVFTPALLALGLFKRMYAFQLLALTGFAVMFAITAEKTLFLLPLAMIGFSKVLQLKVSHLSLIIGSLAALSVLVAVASAYSEDSLLLGFFALYFVFRTIAVPGGMLAQYWDVFDTQGYTLWSHVSVISWFSPAPTQYAANSGWPQLGYIVADYALGVDSNSNANLFVYDGIAAAGNFGILVVCLLLGIWLVVLDKATRGVDYRFSAVVLFPIAFLLTNGPIFSILLSFGGLFWVAVFLSLRRAKMQA